MVAKPPDPETPTMIKLRLALHHRRFLFEKRKHVRVLKRRNVYPSWFKVALEVEAGSIEPKFLVLGSRLPHKPSSSSFPIPSPAKCDQDLNNTTMLRASCVLTGHKMAAIQGGYDRRIWGNGPLTRGHVLVNLSNAGSKDKCNPSIPRLTGPQAMPTCMNFGQG
ncbi:hypothetical protein SMACR_08972 [Sordaria macrospora]|uniref:WGS project CABT00000000 data, contig 2.82 n=2 Tax=Sordaria macrospora TaxID=5147 RepID=F7WBQ6_SORMK|nr:uncharacterized protein SMAC_08972 [Sordaria macrospora k-hell]KAA8624229.1 hypothetical protein SMACR_08972 [Sordaria macrospora]KAH7635297.1 hypothetical protein B0T09DRAFT_21436 [Sordaria sp. MPI-SDFR-AT-0083]WPJ67244.1 hypothetical protein SMAC4_08972 [Sordaria macrospora]CCC05471.1 unnamed protein product [Sordaria macrospora k-hell]